MTEHIENIDKVFREGLCTQCGTCYSACPKDNIAIRRSKFKDYIFYVMDSNKCKGCMICLKVCPGIEVDFDEISTELFKDTNSDKLIGNFEKTYLTQATNALDRNRGASGGSISTLLAYALEKGIIDGALIVKMEPQSPLEPKIFIGRTKEEIFSAAQSKYIPVPINVGLKEILKCQGRYALVGTPCHIHGLRKMQKVFPRLKKKVAFSLGLFCCPGPGFLLIDHLLLRLKVKEEDIISFRFREKSVEGKWPGGVQIILKNGETRYIPVKNYLYAQTIFTRRRCDICSDLACELADISLGDAHLPEFWKGDSFRSSDKSVVLRGEDGWNSTITRTKIGENLIRGAYNEGMLDIVEIDAMKTKEAQKSGLYFKKRAIFARMRIMRFINRRIPKYTGLTQESELKLVEFIKPAVFILTGYLVQNRLFRIILARLPLSFLTFKLHFKQRLIKKFPLS